MSKTPAGGLYLEGESVSADKGCGPAGANGAWPETLAARPSRLNGAGSDDNTQSVLPCEGPFETRLFQSPQGKGRWGRSGARP